MGGNIGIVLLVLICCIVYKLIEVQRRRKVSRVASKKRKLDSVLDEPLLLGSMKDSVVAQMDVVLKEFTFKDLKHVSKVSWGILVYFGVVA